MNTVELGDTGRRVGQLALGCMLFGTTTPKAEACKMMDGFIESGGTYLDTANCYAWWNGSGEYVGDESEEVIGEWLRLRGMRDRVFLATKVGARLNDPAAARNPDGSASWEKAAADFELLSPRKIRKACEDSLRRLKTDVIDLYYVHIEDRSTPLEETMEALNRLVEEGKVKHLGCSNHRTWRLERGRNIAEAKGWAPFVAIQQEYSYLRPKGHATFGVDIHTDQELLDYLTENPSVTLVAYTPLLKGIYNDPESRSRFYNWELFNTEDSRVRYETLRETAADLGVTGNQLVLAWLLHHSPKVIPLLGTRTLEQFSEGIAAADIRLSPEIIERLSAAQA